jgi:cystathionine gamma-synthase
MSGSVFGGAPGRAPEKTEGWGFETRAVHTGNEPDAASGAVVPPISVSTTFAQRAVGDHQGWDYSRSGNPSRDALETCLAALEGARHGFAFASGLAAEDAVLRLLVPGQRTLLGDDAYGGTFRLIDKVYAPAGYPWTAVDLTEPDTVAGDWPTDARLVWLETPTNPALRIVDIAAVAEIAHAHGALVVVDNTFATPYLTRPLDHGADVVVHSATKYLGGHSDVVGGFVALNDNALAERVGFVQNAAGAVPSPFDCYLVQRGLKTLALRMDRHCANARAVAEMLVEHPAVERVLWPGLDSHPGHDVAKRQMRDFGGMVSLVARGGEDRAVALVERTELFTLAESLGAVESLIEHPHRMTHASAAGSPLAVDPALVRLSVGIETAADLVADLAQALDSL